MKKPLKGLWAGCLLFFLILTGSLPAFAAPQPDAGLKSDCLAATVKAITKEMERHRQWLEVRKQQGDEKGAAAMEEELTRLQNDLDKYQTMDVKDYILPSPIQKVVWIGETFQEDAILSVEGMTKSGPWYHAVGIAGGDYGILKPVARYSITFYPVYPRSYWNMTSAYVYIAAVDAKDAPQEVKRIQGEVFATLYSGVSGKLIKCDAYKVYLLPNDSPGVRGELLFEARQSDFDIAIPAAKIRQYPYLEFVSPYGSKTIDLRKIAEDEWLDIYLTPQVIVKKPVIYLYPKDVQPVEIRHDFKGRLLTTFPEYRDGWTVIASPSGDLLNTKDNRHYQYLFWDGIYDFPPEHYRFASGFAVKKEDYAAFLQEKLRQIGLNGREINDFIVYWLPEMNKYQNCFVHFRINDNIDGSSILTVNPQPQTMIRVFMEFYGFDVWDDRPRMPEQKLPSILRQGFTLVEWGGSKLDFFPAGMAGKVERNSPRDGASTGVDFTYLWEDEDIRFYGLTRTGQSSEALLLRLELGPAARERLQRERPPTIDPKDGLAQIAVAECWVKANPANGINVVEQVWLDDNNQIVGRVEGGQYQGDAWPAKHLANACIRFLKFWFLGKNAVTPPQETTVAWPQGIEKWLWGINWDADMSETKRVLMLLGLAWQGGSDASTGDSWLKVSQAPFFGLACEYKLTWHNDRLTTVEITSADAKSMDIGFAYERILAAFTADYGSPAQKVSYTLKIFPPVWVERSSWVIKPDTGIAFTVTVSQQRQEVFPYDADLMDRPGKLSVIFKRLLPGND